MTSNIKSAIIGILQGAAECGLTDEQIFRALSMVKDNGTISPSGARTRRAELVTAGLVVATGEKRTAASGRYTAVWAAAEAANIGGDVAGAQPVAA